MSTAGQIMNSKTLYKERGGWSQSALKNALKLSGFLWKLIPFVERNFCGKLFCTKLNSKGQEWSANYFILRSLHLCKVNHLTKSILQNKTDFFQEDMTQPKTSAIHLDTMNKGLHSSSLKAGQMTCRFLWKFI